MNTSQEKRKLEWSRPLIYEVHYPLQIKSTQDRMNWIAAMMVDTRLNDRDKLILTRLAMHLNLKTGRCDPSHGLLAFELSIAGDRKNGERVIRRSLERAAGLRWVKRQARNGGNTQYRKQSNKYWLDVPEDVFFLKGSRPIGQIEPTDRTNEGGAIGLHSPINSEVEYMKYKSSVLSERAPQQAAVPLKEKIAIEGSKKKAAIELDDSDIQTVVDFLVNEDGPVSLGAILRFAKDSHRAEHIRTADVLEMARLGYLTRLHDSRFELGPKADPDE
jgi:hypothetical protein